MRLAAGVVETPRRPLWTNLRTGAPDGPNRASEKHLGLPGAPCGCGRSIAQLALKSLSAEDSAAMGILLRPRRRWFAVGVVLLAVAGVSAQVSLVRGHPLGQGSVSSSLGLGSSCRGFEPTATMARCNEVAFVPGSAVGLGFSVRNNGPVPLTIIAVKGLGSESSAALAELVPVLPPPGGPGAVTFALDGTRPFQPIDLAPGQDAAIQFVGRMRSCDAVRGHWSPGTGMRFTIARLTVRVLAMSSEIEVPLQQGLQIISPAAGVCP